MSWISGDLVVNELSKKTMNGVYASIRHRVRCEANLEEFPDMGNNIMPVRLINDGIFGSYDEAYEYCMIKNTDWQRKYNVAVPFRGCDDLQMTKKLQSLNTRLTTERQKLSEYEAAHEVTMFKADFVGCPKCKSKLARGYLRNSKCPVCREDMRSKTTKDTLARYRAKIRKLEKEISDEKNKQNTDKKYLICFIEYIG